ncbi:uncharacterized protein V6R79_008310 [Siganus canaliculatus]
MSRTSSPMGPLNLWNNLEVWLQVMTSDLQPALGNALKEKSKAQLEENLMELVANFPKKEQGSKDLAKIFGALAQNLLAHATISEKQQSQAEEEIKDQQRHITALQKHLQAAWNEMSDLKKEIRVNREDVQRLRTEHKKDKDELTQTKRELEISYQIGRSPSLQQHLAEKTSPVLLQSQREELQKELADTETRTVKSPNETSLSRNPKKSSSWDKDQEEKTFHLLPPSPQASRKTVCQASSTLVGIKVSMLCPDMFVTRLPQFLDISRCCSLKVNCLKV